MKIGFLGFDHLRDWTGISRLIDQLACEMIGRGHRVVIVAEEASPSKRIPVSPRAYEHELITLDLTSAQARQQAREKIAKSGIDICVTSVGSTQLLQVPGLFWGSGIPLCIGEPADPRVISFERWHPYEHYGVLACADAIQVLLPQYAPQYPEPLRSRITVIGNPIPQIADVDLVARRNKDTRTLLGVGRFNDNDKRFSLLLQAFALLHGEFADWRLKLVGDGPHWEYYHLMVEQLGIASFVEFTGSVADPETHYADADLFCLPSGRAEGFPLVLAEAAAHALPLAGFKTCAACEALIAPDRGVLVESSECPEEDTPVALAAGLRSLMACTPEVRECMGIQAREILQARYGGIKIFDAWESLLVQTLEKTQKCSTTALERIRGAHMDKTHEGPQSNWEGLEPTSAVWTDKLLAGAAQEIALREDPLKAPEASEACEKVESVRLRSELARLKEDYEALDRKYAVLLQQYQTRAEQAQRKQTQRSKRKK